MNEKLVKEIRRQIRRASQLFAHKKQKPEALYWDHTTRTYQQDQRTGRIELEPGCPRHQYKALKREVRRGT